MSFTLLRLLGLAGAAQAACSNLVIDNFSRSTVSGSNNLDAWTSEDTSMSKAAINKGILSFTPKTDSSSYYYETLGCVKAATQGYNALSLTVKGPKDASMMLEIQTKASCADDNYNSQWVQINGLTGSTQNISIALSSFTNANLDAVSAFRRVESPHFDGPSHYHHWWFCVDFSLCCGFVFNKRGDTHFSRFLWLNLILRYLGTIAKLHGHLSCPNGPIISYVCFLIPPDQISFKLSYIERFFVNRARNYFEIVVSNFRLSLYCPHRVWVIEHSLFDCIYFRCRPIFAGVLELQ
ncbi:hypothetical protein CGLO_07056 [Colletotrichum gloeosporioides Cg-14]|uniref:Uncharacterized protein n=1 Tax=Colletotrichum gloeosporioides (strain Cg-14) TaxID=1237896 RepID=T0LNF9_COLGC|nr:hypothetical protein CGLO_07056 [Colletotrichum gloeosporioides Cg-14]